MFEGLTIGGGINYRGQVYWGSDKPVTSAAFGSEVPSKESGGSLHINTVATHDRC
ncbi:hypothetical protein FHT02_002263 [Sphingomonas xinjiangensis]|uniref:Uncharacterized protein n=1 Tax=Sphingomonas xinjiangensis TaxID=643568 RepID=A0A840YQY9_9SPHN|nr:hypothetical protein [Sphingomonas xinjiangensis]